MIISRREWFIFRQCFTLMWDWEIHGTAVRYKAEDINVRLIILIKIIHYYFIAFIVDAVTESGTMWQVYYLDYHSGFGEKTVKNTEEIQFYLNSIIQIHCKLENRTFHMSLFGIYVYRVFEKDLLSLMTKTILNCTE